MFTHALSVILDIFNRGSRVFVFSYGVSPPHAEVLLFRQKDPKPLAPGRGPRGVPLPQSRMLGLRNSLRSDSPRHQIGFGTGAQPRPQAPGHGAIRSRRYNYEIPRFARNDHIGVWLGMTGLGFCVTERIGRKIVNQWRLPRCYRCRTGRVPVRGTRVWCSRFR